MLESLLSSRVRAKLLTAFMLTPGEEHNAWELANLLGENYSAIWKELIHLESLKIISSEYRGRSKMYRIYPDCPILQELRSIVLKTEGIGKVIRQRLSEMGAVQVAFIYGSYAAGDADLNSDLDLMIIGEVNMTQFASLITEFEKELRRPINYVIFSEEEWRIKVSEDDPFVRNIIQSPKVMLIGDEHAL